MQHIRINPIDGDDDKYFVEVTEGDSFYNYYKDEYEIIEDDFVFLVDHGVCSCRNYSLNIFAHRMNCTHTFPGNMQLIN